MNLMDSILYLNDNQLSGTIPSALRTIMQLMSVQLCEEYAIVWSEVLVGVDRERVEEVLRFCCLGMSSEVSSGC